MQELLSPYRLCSNLRGIRSSYRTHAVEKGGPRWAYCPIHQYHNPDLPGANRKIDRQDFERESIGIKTQHRARVSPDESVGRKQAHALMGGISTHAQLRWI